jgi:hypothetical protein
MDSEYSEPACPEWTSESVSARRRGRRPGSVIGVTVTLWGAGLLSTVLLKHYFFGMAG